MLVTYTGKIFDYDNITKDDICISDIIHSLTRINRFIGHSSRAYSVAEHTFYCLLIAEKMGYSTKQKLQVLIHDFTEAYVGDCPSPLKAKLPMFEEIESEVEEAILSHLELEQLTEEEYKLVKKADLTMLVVEMRDLTLHDHFKYINENTYLEILDDEDFNLNLKAFEEVELQKMLHNLFNNLFEEYKREMIK